MNELEKAPFSWEDPFLLENSLSAEERMVMKTARDYAGAKLAPRIRNAFRDESFDPAIMREMGELGLLGMTLPEPYGGGLSYTCYGLVAREMERVDSAYRSALSVQNSLVMHPIFAFGSEAQKKKYLPGLADGQLDRLLRAYRTRSRLRSRRHDRARGEGWRGLSPHRRQDVDHQFAHRRCSA